MKRLMAIFLPKQTVFVLSKRRYLIPWESHTIELDVFDGTYQGLILAEVEFNTEEEALSFVPPAWFDRDVTFTGEFQNSRLSKGIKFDTSEHCK